MTINASSAAPVAEDKNVFIKIVFEDTQETAVDSYTALIRAALLKYHRTFMFAS